MNLKDAFKGKYKGHELEIDHITLPTSKLGQESHTQIVEPTTPQQQPQQLDPRPTYVLSIELAQEDCHLICMFLIIFTLSFLFSKNKT